MHCKILRIEKGISGVFGVWLIEKDAFCVTLELPDRGNQRLVSCIPEGQYPCARFQSPKFGDTFQIHGVPNRDLILLHAGNTIVDSHGCILMGASFGKLKGNRAILNSGSTFKSFMAEMGTVQQFDLTIEEVV